MKFIQSQWNKIRRWLSFSLQLQQKRDRTHLNTYTHQRHLLARIVLSIKWTLHSICNDSTQWQWWCCWCRVWTLVSFAAAIKWNISKRINRLGLFCWNAIIYISTFTVYISLSSALNLFSPHPDRNRVDRDKTMNEFSRVFF